MTTYEVQFETTISVIVEVDAADEAEAMSKAQAEFEKRESDSLPEVWPMDFHIHSVEAL